MFKAMKKESSEKSSADRPGTLTFLVNKTKNRSNLTKQKTSLDKEELKENVCDPTNVDIVPVSQDLKTPTDPALLLPASADTKEQINGQNDSNKISEDIREENLNVDSKVVL